MSEYFAAHPFPSTLSIGILVIVSFYAGKLSKKFIKLPTIIGYMIFGVIAGPSILNLISKSLQYDLTFITEIALGFVAVSIGLELNFSSLKKQGKGIALIIFFQSFLTFLIVFAGVYLVTKNIVMAIILAAISPATAPAGTVAIIQEFKAKGSLTKALFAVVGFDDGFGIIIFGFAFAISKSIVRGSMNNISVVILASFKEIFLSIIIGLFIAAIFCKMIRNIQKPPEVISILFGTIIFTVGISNYLHLSFILTNMIIGILVVNTQPYFVTKRIHEQMSLIMPMFFLMFFSLAGCNLHISVLPSIGALGAVYIVTRTIGKVSGASIGAKLGNMESKITKYLGIATLSQAGIAIGLALLVKQEFGIMGGTADEIGSMVLTTVTATSIFFEIIGPICAKIGLKKAGEIKS